MAYVDSELKTVYYAACEDCGWYSEEDFETEREAEISAKDHEDNECSENNEADHRTDREKYQDTLDALANAVRIQNG